jgi:hypothetical protein
MRKLANTVGKEIGLQYPISVKIVEGDGVTEDWAAYHMLVRRKHFIKIGSNPARGFCNVLAHEIAHALTEEAYPDAEFHGVEFGVACLIVVEAFKRCGIDIDNIFDFEIDV